MSTNSVHHYSTLFTSVHQCPSVSTSIHQCPLLSTGDHRWPARSCPCLQATWRLQRTKTGGVQPSSGPLRPNKHPAAISQKPPHPSLPASLYSGHSSSWWQAGLRGPTDVTPADPGSSRALYGCGALARRLPLHHCTPYHRTLASHTCQQTATQKLTF